MKIILFSLVFASLAVVPSVAHTYRVPATFEGAGSSSDDDLIGAQVAAQSNANARCSSGLAIRTTELSCVKPVSSEYAGIINCRAEFVCGDAPAR